MVCSIGTHQPHPLVGIHVEEEDVIVVVDDCLAGPAPGVDPEHFTKTLQPLVFILEAVGRGGGPGTGMAVSRASSHGEPVATRRVVQAYGIPNTNRPGPVHAVDVEDIGQAIGPVAAVHVKPRAGVSDTGAARAPQPVVYTCCRDAAELLCSLGI